jgi:tripartite-type tricarboxylate transporter receptor subunit TctC
MRWLCLDPWILESASGRVLTTGKTVRFTPHALFFPPADGRLSAKLQIGCGKTIAGGAMSRSRVLTAILMTGFAFATLPAVPADAQTYPSRNITFVVGFAAGGVADSIGRLVGQKLGDRLGQSVVVENRPGAAGNIAAKMVAGSAADGYTILVTTTSLAINETLHKNKGFTADDFTTVAIAASSPESLSVPPITQANNIGEFLKAFQGKPINFGSAGAGSGSHIAAEYFFKALAKASATHVPFQGGAPAMNAAIAGHIDLLAATVGGGVAVQIKERNLKGIAMASEKRVAVTPEVPTFAEGGFPGFTAASWVGFFAPAKTPSNVIVKLHDAIEAIIKEADMQQRLASLGFDPVTGTRSEADAMFKAEVAKWGKMVTTLDMTVN